MEVNLYITETAKPNKMELSSNAANKIYQTNRPFKFSVNFNDQSFSSMKNSHETFQQYSKPTLTGNDYLLSNFDSDNPFKTATYDRNNPDKGKKIVHFSNREGQRFPKMALNHAAVYLDNKFGIKEDKNVGNDEIPDENIDERSLSKVRDSLISRGSITNKLSQITSTGDLFRNTRSKIDLCASSNAPLVHIQNFNLFNSRLKNMNTPKAETLNMSYCSAKSQKNMPPCVPTTEVLLKNSSTLKSFRNSITDNSKLVQKFLSMVAIYHKKKKQF